MPKRWTILELQMVEMDVFIKSILTERRDALTNPHSPLAVKLGKATAYMAKRINTRESMKGDSDGSEDDT